MILIFLPVSMYKVKYQVAAGRPFSRFERLLLNAIGGGFTDLSSLVDLFRIHRRMVVEALVTLMQTGWVSIGAQTNHFALTPAGAAASNDDKVLPATVSTEERWQIVVMERMYGQVARSDKVRAETKRTLSKIWHLGVRMPNSDISNTLEPGMVRQHLSYGSGERVRWVGPITTASADNAFVVVAVDVNDERIIGIPPSWRLLLADELLSRARRRQREMVDSRLIIDPEEARRFIAPVEADLSGVPNSYGVNSEDLAWAHGDEENAALMEHFLTNSRSLIVVASTHLQADVVERQRPSFERALRAGRTICICWGQTPSDGDSSNHREALRLLEKIQWDSKRDSASGKLVVANSEGRFHSNVILGDIDGQFEAALGSYTWLGNQSPDQKHASSIHFWHPGLVSDVCDILGDYQESDARLKRATGLTRLRNAAVELSTAADAIGNEPATLRISLLRDRSSAAAFRQAMLGACNSVSASAYDLGDFETETLIFLKRVLQARDKLVIEIQHSDPRSFNMAELVSDKQLLQRISLHVRDVRCGNVVCVDECLLLFTSYPILGEVKRGARTFGGDVGIKLEGTPLNVALIRQLGVSLNT